MRNSIFKKDKVSLYLVTDRKACGSKDFFKSIEEAIKNGVNIVQLREKELPYDAFLSVAKAVKRITDNYNIPLIINDDVDVAIDSDAAGVHVGQADTNPIIVRRRIGKEKIIGMTVESIEQSKLAQGLPIDYIGVQVFLSDVKNDGVMFGKAGLKEIASFSRVPVVAIGGINKENINLVIESKVSAVAIVSAILSGDDVGFATRELKLLMEKFYV